MGEAALHRLKSRGDAMLALRMREEEMTAVLTFSDPEAADDPERAHVASPAVL